MNLWTKTQPKIQRTKPKRFWLLALGQRTVALWARWSGREAHPGFEDEPAPSPAIPAAEDPATPSSPALQGPADPLQHWLELVRKNAPALLIPPEEGGTPWHTASDAVGHVPDQPKQKPAPWQRTGEHDKPFEELEQKLGPVPAAPSAVLRTEQSVQRQASSSGIDKPARSQAPKQGSVPEAAPGDFSEKKTSQLPEQRGKVSSQNKPQQTHSPTPSLSGSAKAHRADSNKSPMDKKPVQTLSNRETSKFRQLPNNASRLPPSGNQTDRRGTQRTAQQPLLRPVFLSSSKQMTETTVTRAALVETNSSFSPAPDINRIPSLPGIEDRKSERVDLTSGILRKSPGAHRCPELPQSRPALNAEENLLRPEEVPAQQPMQPVDRWSTLEFDPWPELPENPPSTGGEWMEAFQSRERIRVLDFEQQGGARWNE